MENHRTFLIIALLAISAVLYQKWLEFSYPKPEIAPDSVVSTAPQTTDTSSGVPTSDINTDEQLPTAPTTANGEMPTAGQLPDEIANNAVGNSELITVRTDLLIAKINPLGGVIESLELIKQPVSLEQKDQGYPLLKNTAQEVYVAQDGLILSSSSKQTAPNHLKTRYTTRLQEYDLGSADSIVVPLSWVSEEGIQYTKNFVFQRDSYVVNIEYKVQNNTAEPWNGYLYAQFSRSEPQSKRSSFGQLPSYTGGAIYTPAEKYEKVDFDDMEDEKLKVETQSGWVAMLQHYFVGVWIPQNGAGKEFYSGVSRTGAKPIYRLGYKTLAPKTIAAGQSGTIGSSIYLGPKEQSRLKKIQKDQNINGLALTVDYGFLTFIADPLFVVLNWINNFVGNWGWSIIILTFLIKLLFYPLSAASYKSMAGMKKLQPRLQTLKERYKDDKQKFQMEMMALYKKEKINPAGGCLPILVQIPVFIALYWVLLESVEIRHAPFALWLQDLSAPDPLYILPVLMGASMWLQTKLNPAPMDDIQKKVMLIMPFALTFLFLTFPQGLVLYWVVNNILSIAQQWIINKRLAV